MNLAFDLNTIWYFLVGILFTGYAILDGFDFGVGTLHLFGRNDEERRTTLNAIAPVWDGNEVWLVTGGGALFAAFPEVYASAFSGFYIAFMLLLASLIFRAVAIEFRSKQPMRWWRQLWDMIFSLGSTVAALLIGVAMGNVAWGLPLNQEHNYMGSFFSLLHPYALLNGLLVVILFMLHGSLFLALKTEGNLQNRLQGWTQRLYLIFILLFIVHTATTWLFVPRLTEILRQQPLLWILPLVLLIAILMIQIYFSRGQAWKAFLSSSAVIVVMMLLYGLGSYPYLIYSVSSPENSLTIYNAASSPKTLRIMLLIALIGMPLVLLYTANIYRIFRGKVRLDEHSY